MARRAWGEGTVTPDPVKGGWRVAVTVDGQRIYRRTQSEAEAWKVWAQLIAQRRGPSGRYWQDAGILAVDDLTPAQIGVLLALIATWTTDTEE